MTKSSVILGLVLLSAQAVPAWARDRPTVPTNFLATETAHVLPAGEAFLSVGAGWVPGYVFTSLGYSRGLEIGGEIRAHVGALPSLLGGVSYEGGLGYKHGLLRSETWALAINSYAFYSQFGPPHSGGFLLSLPATFPVGASHATLEARAYFPDLASTPATPLNGSAVGMKAAFAWQVSPGMYVDFEAMPALALGYNPGAFAGSVALGTRWSPGERLWLTAHLAADLLGIGGNPAMPDRSAIVGAGIQYRL